MKILVVGAGNIGQIYINHFCKLSETQNDLKITALVKEKHAMANKNEKCNYISSLKNIEKQDYIFICVKPQDFYSVSTFLNFVLSENCVVVSAMAGHSIEIISKVLNHQKIIRIMPNAAIQFGSGMTGVFFAKFINRNNKNEFIKLLEKTGKLLELEVEEKINSVTALSGSGPAYFFYLAKQMTKAAIEMGFDTEVANTLVLQTFKGAHDLFAHSGLNAEQLISVVASKKGTTEAALNHFERGKVEKFLVDGILKAEKRGEELGKEIIHKS